MDLANDVNRMVNDKEAAAFLGMGVQTLRDWRSNGRVALPYSKIGSAVRYRYGDLVEFAKKNRQEPRRVAA